MSTQKTMNDFNITQWAEETLALILRGEKPGINMDDPNQSWLFKQMKQMHRDGLLSEVPESYVVLLPDEDPEDQNLLHDKGVTVREPLPKQLTTEAWGLKGLLESNYDIRNVKVFGEDYGFRYKRTATEQLDYADALVLTKGDLVGFHQWLSVYNGHQDKTVNLNDKVCILQNADDFWKPFLDVAPDIADDHNRFLVTNTNHDTAKLLKTLMPHDRASTPARNEESVPQIKPGDTIFSVTGNIKKPLEYDKVMMARGNGIRIDHFQRAFDIKPEGAVETSNTYVGNNIEKFAALYNLIKHAYTPDRFVAELERKRYSLEKSYLLFDDNGLETNANLTDGPEFSDCMALRQNSYKSCGPGPETKHLMGAVQNRPYNGAYGTLSFVERIKAAYNRKLEEQKAQGVEDPHVSLDGGDHGCALVASLAVLVDQIRQGMSFDEVMEANDFFIFSAKTHDRIVFDPEPAVGAIDTKNFTIPKYDPKGRTKAMNRNYVAHHSLGAQLIKSISRTFGFARTIAERQDLRAQFFKATGRELTIATQHTIAEGQQSKELETLSYPLQDGNGGFYDMANRRPHEIPLADGEVMEIEAPLNNFSDMCKQVDGFVFSNDDDALRGQDYFWERNFYAFSIHVGNQITDKSIAGKPSIFLEGPVWDQHRSVVETFCGGLIPEMPEYLYKVASDTSELEKKIGTHFENYSPHELPEHIYKEGGEKAPEDLFRVTVYCSASSTNAEFKAKARHFALDCAGLGFALKNGGGTGPDGLMTETSDGMHDAREHFAPFLDSYGYKLPVNHVTSIQCPETEQEEGLRKDNDFWCVWPNIFLRMQDLQDTEAEVVLPGGAGTIQEICASIIMRKNGFTDVENRPLIIVDSDGIYQPFLDTIPAEDYEKYNIHVVRSEGQALELLMEAREARNMTPDLDYDYEEYQELRDEFMQNLPPAIRLAFFPSQKPGNDNDMPAVSPA